MIEDLYPKIKRYLDLWETDGKGTMKFREGGWTWGDWGDNKDMILLYNLWYYIAIRGMYNITGELNYSDDFKKYELFLEEFRNSFNQQFWNGSAYRHSLYREATDDRVQALAVVSGIADKSKYPQLLKVFLREEHASPYMEKYVFEAMMKMGYEKEAIERHKKRFAYMVDHPDFTTLFEGWGIGENGFGGGTVNHGWSGGGLAICSQYICGIAPVTPGFKELQIMPQPGPLKYAEAKVESVKGEIKSKFQVEKDKLSMEVTIPNATKARVGVPRIKKYNTIKVNEHLVWKNGKYIDNKIVGKGEITNSHITFNLDYGNYSILAE